MREQNSLKLRVGVGTVIGSMLTPFVQWAADPKPETAYAAVAQSILAGVLTWVAWQQRALDETLEARKRKREAKAAFPDRIEL